MKVIINTLFRWWFAICIMMGSLSLTAQQTPVQVTAILSPPYSLSLASYVRPGSQKLRIHLLLKDFTKLEYRAKLRVTIEGVGITITTKANFFPRPIILSGGVLEIFSGDELAEYFHPDNLEFAGLSKRVYQRTNQLPEGFYRFIIEVLDYNRGKSIYT